MKALIKKAKVFAQKIWDKVDRLWNRLNGEVKEHIFDVIKYVNAVKEVVREGTLSGELIEAGVKITPTKIDDKGLAILRLVTLDVLAKLTLSQEIINEPDKGEKLKKIVAMVRTFDKVQNDMYWNALYQELLTISLDGEITGYELAGFGKFAYYKYKELK